MLLCVCGVLCGVDVDSVLCDRLHKCVCGRLCVCVRSVSGVRVVVAHLGHREGRFDNHLDYLDLV